MTIRFKPHPNHLIVRGLPAATVARGGAGSGHYGHAGRPGEKGGSAPGSGGAGEGSGGGHAGPVADRMFNEGFAETSTGGGFYAWERNLPGGGYVMITDTEGAYLPTSPTAKALVGWYNKGGEQVGSRIFPDLNSAIVAAKHTGPPAGPLYGHSGRPGQVGGAKP